MSGSEQVLGGAWIEAQLLGSFAVTSLVAGRIYEELAPDNTTYPFIVWQVQSPGRDIRGVGTARVLTDIVYAVRAVSEAATYSEIMPIANAIDDALHGEEGPIVVSGNSAYVGLSMRDSELKFPEEHEGKHIKHLGGIYRLQVYRT